MQRRKLVYSFILISLLLVLAGCTEKKAPLTDGREVYVEEQEEKQEEKKEQDSKKEQKEKLFLITGLDTKRKKITLKGYKESDEIEYRYTGATIIQDKYGTDISIEGISCGELVNARVREDKAEFLQLSEEVFTYDDIHNFTINQKEHSITVGKNIYYYEEDIQVFYRDNKISVDEISSQDTLCLKGIEKKVYAIQVTEGHGTVVLQNTGTFEGGSITIGNIMSLEITKDMRIEVPEGKHLLSAEHDGYGGSREITVEANRETSVNLEELKGEGPAIGNIVFKLEPENAELYLNGEKIDTGNSHSLKYGNYRLSAKAEGYADWNRTLVVNSKEAEILIELQTIEEAEEEAAEKEKEEQEKEEQEKEEQEKEERENRERERQQQANEEKEKEASSENQSSKELEEAALKLIEELRDRAKNGAGQE